MLKRSGQVPLTIIENAARLHQGRKLMASKSLVLKQMHLIEVLHLGFNIHTCDMLSRLDATDAPLLRTLVIIHDVILPEMYTRFDSVPGFSLWKLPSLVRLALYNRMTRMHISSDEPLGKLSLSFIRPTVRPTLTHFVIDTLKEPISVDVCLDLLRKLPMLETLALKDVLESMEDIPDHTRPPRASRIVDLPYLRHISVQRTGI
jgi:hypothetical protein